MGSHIIKYGKITPQEPILIKEVENNYRPKSLFKGFNHPICTIGSISKNKLE